jgi:hypothetical protein
MLRKKGIIGTLADGPITEHLQFGRIQWNQSYSHMPRGHRAKAVDGPELMDMDEPPTVELVEPAVEPYVVDEEEEYEETITMRGSDLLALHMPGTARGREKI